MDTQKYHVETEAGSTHSTLFFPSSATRPSDILCRVGLEKISWYAGSRDLPSIFYRYDHTTNLGTANNGTGEREHFFVWYEIDGRT